MICFILTITSVLPSDKGKWGYEVRTDLRQEAIYSSPWFRLPYPGIYADVVAAFIRLCVFFTIIRPHRSTTYVDAVYCYRPSSVVCRSVGLSH